MESLKQPRRRWMTERIGLTGGILRLGERAAWSELPADAVVSITHGIGLSVRQRFLNNLINNLFILPPLTGNPDLLYAELHGDLLSGESVTLTAWRGRGMTIFRDHSAHGWAKRLLTGILFGGQAILRFLTYQPCDGRLPSVDEARALAETHGRMMQNGQHIPAATRLAQTHTR